MAFEITGKVALVTGGASTIGLACVKELLRNGLKGATIVDINPKYGKQALEEIIQEFGPNKAIYFQADISNKKSFKAAFEITVQTFKNFDILINNAGVFNDLNWEEEIAVNVSGTTNGTVLALNEYIPKFKTGPEGVIVNISSIAGIAPEYSVPIYSATKSFVLSMSRAFGDENYYKNSGVRVISLCPGATESNLIRGRQNKHMGPEYEAHFDEIVKMSHVQDPKFVGLAVVKIIIQGKSGSVWISLNSKEPYEFTEFPESPIN